ncbi:ABC transporter ATP-binding protein/permease [Clostridium amazonitimonense]|nr:ABC transporter ATP-binding protein/permease [Clostridium amazonitimonense]
MKDGNIIADGKHNDLYTTCQHYKELYDNSMKIQVREEGAYSNQ